MSGSDRISRADGGAWAPVLAALHHGTRRPGDDAWDARAFAEVLAMPGVTAWVSGTGGAPAGFVVVRTAADECEILMVGVVRDCRRTGVGRRLMEAALAAAAGAGARRAFLEVAEDNGPARAFYASLGFAAAGRRPGYYRRRGVATDALVLARDVGG